MTVKELVDRLNELNCPDYELELSGGAELNLNNVRFANTGTKVILGNFDERKNLYDLIEDLKDYQYEIERASDNLMDVIGELEELI